MRADLAETGLAAAVQAVAKEYARDTGESVSEVEAALRRLLRKKSPLESHPVVSGELRRDIDAHRAAHPERRPQRGR